MKFRLPREAQVRTFVAAGQWSSSWLILVSLLVTLWERDGLINHNDDHDCEVCEFLKRIEAEKAGGPSNGQV